VIEHVKDEEVKQEKSKNNETNSFKEDDDILKSLLDIK